jgi:hypothetical protein
MNAGTFASKQNKTQYSEMEAAQALGITVEQLRVLIRTHIAKSDDELNHIGMASFHPSDLLVLKLLARQTSGPTLQDSIE